MSEYVFGIDIGTNTIKIGLFSKELELLEKWDISLNKIRKGESVLPFLAEFINEKSIGKNIAGIGLSVAGHVTDKSIVQDYKELGFGSSNVKSAFEKMTGHNVVVINDSNAAALGENYLLKNNAHKNAFFISIGKKISGAIISNGEILTGFNGSGGEVGHIIINPFETEMCSCGRCGCLEQYASLSGIIKYAKTLKLSRIETKLGNIFTIKDIAILAEKGDVLCSKVVEFAGFNIGLALSMVTCIFDPEAIYIGGGIVSSGENIVQSIIKNYKKYAYKNTSKIPIEVCMYEEEAGIYGAAKSTII